MTKMTTMVPKMEAPAFNTTPSRPKAMRPIENQVKNPMEKIATKPTSNIQRRKSTKGETIFGRDLILCL